MKRGRRRAMRTDWYREGFSRLLFALLLASLLVVLAMWAGAADSPAGSFPAGPAVSEPPPSSSDWQETTSLLVAVFKAIGSLALVVALIGMLAFGLKKMGWGRESLGQNTLIKVLDTRLIAPKKYVAVLQVANEAVVVGITDQQITMLTKLEGSDALTELLTAAKQGRPGAGPASFSSVLRRAISGRGDKNRDAS